MSKHAWDVGVGVGGHVNKYVWIYFEPPKCSIKNIREWFVQGPISDSSEFPCVSSDKRPHVMPYDTL